MYTLPDADIVAVSPSSVYRVPKEKELFQRWNSKPSSKGTGVKGPVRARERWHIDISYINVKGTFYYLTSIPDRYSRYMLHLALRESMTEENVEIVFFIPFLILEV